MGALVLALPRNRRRRLAVVSGLLSAVTAAGFCSAPAAVADASPVVTTSSGQQVQVTTGMPECGLMAMGTVGTCVVSLQYWLDRFEGSGLVLDGDFGAATQSAVMDYEENHGLAVDGIVGPAVRAAIADDYSVDLAQPADAQLPADEPVSELYPGQDAVVASNDYGTVQLWLNATSDRIYVDVVLGPASLVGATFGASVEGDAVINGKRTAWRYSDLSKSADYRFHSTIHHYRNHYDAPWTSHTIHAGDVVQLTYTAVVPQVNRYDFQVSFDIAVHIN